MKAVYEMPRVHFEAFAANNAVAGCTSGGNESGGGTGNKFVLLRCENPVFGNGILAINCWKNNSFDLNDAAADTNDFAMPQTMQDTSLKDGLMGGLYVSFTGLQRDQSTGYDSGSSSVWSMQNDDLDNSQQISLYDTDRTNWAALSSVSV